MNNNIILYRQVRTWEQRSEFIMFMAAIFISTLVRKNSYQSNSPWHNVQQVVYIIHDICLYIFNMYFSCCNKNSMIMLCFRYQKMPCYLLPMECVKKVFRILSIKMFPIFLHSTMHWLAALQPFFPPWLYVRQSLSNADYRRWNKWKWALVHPTLPSLAPIRKCLYLLHNFQH